MSTERVLPLQGEEPVVVQAAPEDRRIWSVTTLIGCLDKPALVHWAAIKTAEAAVDEHDIWYSRFEREGRASAIDYLKQSRYRGKKGERSAKDLGTAVHKACEYAALHGRFRPEDTSDPELVPFLRGAKKFLMDFQPQYLAAEITVFNETFGYAGTADAFMVIDGTRFICDWKTTREPFDSRGNVKQPYAEVSLQLAAYRHAELAAVWRARQAEVFKRRYYLLNDTERKLAVPVPEVDHGLVIQLTPGPIRRIRSDATPRSSTTFLAVVDAARFQFETSKNVIGAPLIPPRALRDSTDPFAGLPS
jgi:hypothetical protein